MTGHSDGSMYTYDANESMISRTRNGVTTQFVGEYNKSRSYNHALAQTICMASPLQSGLFPPDSET